MLNGETEEAVREERYKASLDFVLECYEKLMNGEVPAEELIISKTLHKDVKDYRSLFPHVVASLQMMQQGAKVKPGQEIPFIYTTADHFNPMRRVMPAAMLNGEHHSYDREKYAQILMDVAETILGVFGFNRRQLGVKPKPRTYLEELRSERIQDILLELETLQD